MTQPLTEQQLADIEARTSAYRQHAPTGFACCSAHPVADAAPVLLAEIRRLQTELAEEKADRNPLLRCLIVKSARDKDQYVGWSNDCEMPAGVWSRETALAYGFPPSRLDRADAAGSSSHIGDGGWDDRGFIAEQRGWLRRELLGDYAIEYLLGDREAAYALLEPFDDEPATP